MLPAIEAVEAGAWAVGVSGGADSVALFRLLRQRSDLSLHVVHLDHQTRGQDSTADAQFVRSLAEQFDAPCTIASRDQIEPAVVNLPANPSARYRAARMALFRQVVESAGLKGVILAHHADDQAETVLHRLLRAAGGTAAPGGLAGMSPRTLLGPLQVLRPLLSLRRRELIEYLGAIDQSWREDASNASDVYLRNRLRRWLADEPELTEALLALSRACLAVKQWSSETAPVLGPSFTVAQLADLPAVLAHESARRWLTVRGAPAGELSEAVVRRLMEMAADAAGAHQVCFPGGVRVRRRRGAISAE